jgi:hypothetical protein
MSSQIDFRAADRGYIIMSLSNTTWLFRGARDGLCMQFLRCESSDSDKLLCHLYKDAVLYFHILSVFIRRSETETYQILLKYGRGKVRTGKVSIRALGEISGSHGGEYKDDRLVGHCAVQSGGSWPALQRCVLLHRPDDGGSRNFWNDNQLPWDHTMQYLRRLSSLKNAPFFTLKSWAYTWNNTVKYIALLWIAVTLLPWFIGRIFLTAELHYAALILQYIETIS